MLFKHWVHPQLGIGGKNGVEYKRHDGRAISIEFTRQWKGQVVNMKKRWHG